MFSVHTKSEEFKKVAIDRFMFEENSGREITWLLWRYRFWKGPFSKCFQNKKMAFSISSGLESVFEKLRFRDGLVWTVGLTVEIKLRFQIPPA